MAEADRTTATNAQELVLDVAQLRQAVESSTREKGAGHRDTINLTILLLECLVRRLEYEEALPHAQHLMTWEERMGDDVHGLLISIGNLAVCLQGLGRLVEAESLHVRALDTAQRELGHEHKTTIACCDALGGTWVKMGKHAEAEGLQRRVVDFNTRLLGLEDAQTMNSIGNLGICLTQTGKLDEAAALLRKALAFNIRAHGLQHSNTIHYLLALANALVKSKDYAQAEPMLRRVMQYSTSIKDRMSSNGHLSALLIHVGRPAEALPVCRQSLEMCQLVRGEAHPDTLWSMGNLAAVLTRLGEHVEAEPLARRALEACTRVLGADHQHTKNAATVLQALAIAAAMRAGVGSNSSGVGRGTSSSGAGRGSSSRAGRGSSSGAGTGSSSGAGKGRGRARR